MQAFAEHQQACCWERRTLAQPLTPLAPPKPRPAQDNGLPGFEQLYNDSQRRRVKLEALAQRPPEEATFRPQVREGAGRPAVLGWGSYPHRIAQLPSVDRPALPHPAPCAGQHLQRGGEEAAGGAGGGGPAGRRLDRRGHQVGGPHLMPAAMNALPQTMQAAAVLAAS